MYQFFNFYSFYQEVCKHLQEDATGEELIGNIVGAANVYANFSGQAKCLDIEQQATGNLGDQGWDFQVSNFSGHSAHKIESGTSNPSKPNLGNF